jgi:predicted phage tail protein
MLASLIHSRFGRMRVFYLKVKKRDIHFLSTSVRAFRDKLSAWSRISIAAVLEARQE